MIFPTISFSCISNWVITVALVLVRIGFFDNEGFSLVNDLPLVASCINHFCLWSSLFLEHFADSCLELALLFAFSHFGTHLLHLGLLLFHLGQHSFFSRLLLLQKTLLSFLFRLVDSALGNKLSKWSQINHFKLQILFGSLFLNDLVLFIKLDDSGALLATVTGVQAARLILNFELLNRLLETFLFEFQSIIVNAFVGNGAVGDI
jgi:hypothetical protein